MAYMKHNKICVNIKASKHVHLILISTQTMAVRPLYVYIITCHTVSCCIELTSPVPSIILYRYRFDKDETSATYHQQNIPCKSP